MYNGRMRFEWDPAKNRLNREKHGLDFVDAESVFVGPHLIRLDPRHEFDEDRWIIIGLSFGRVVVLVYTERDGGETIRIISMRKANKYEQKRFERILGRR